MQYLSNLKKSILNPTEFYSELAKSESNPLNALITFLISNCLLIAMIFLGELLFGGDLIYTTFNYQSNTFILEQITTTQLFGYYIASNQYVLLFFSKLFFSIKIWLVLIGSLYAMAFLFRLDRQIGVKRLFEITGWNSSILLLLGGITAIFLGVRFILPLYYHYCYYCIFIIFFIVLLPSYTITGIGKIAPVSLYKRTLMGLTPILIFFLLWSINHMEIIFAPLI